MKDKENMASKAKSADEMELIIGKSLQVGVLLSAAVTLAGFVMFIASGTGGYPGSTFPTTLTAIFSGLIALKPYAVIMAGLFILILTPVFRVGISILVFLKEKDYRYVKITALVFAILIASFLLGRAQM
jgi:uncharacterized membrane protein